MPKSKKKYKSKNYYAALNTSSKNKSRTNHNTKSQSSSDKCANLQTESDRNKSSKKITFVPDAKLQDVSILPFPVNFLLSKSEVHQEVQQEVLQEVQQEVLQEVHQEVQQEVQKKNTMITLTRNHHSYVNYRANLPPVHERYAGPSYANSPDPSTLPLPSEFLLSKVKHPKMKDIIVFSNQTNHENIGNHLIDDEKLKRKLVIQYKLSIINNSNGELLLPPSFFSI